jgi:hypothetical protein
VNLLKNIFALTLCVAVSTSLAAAKVIPMMDAMTLMDAVHAKVGHSDDLNAHMVGEMPYAIAWWDAASGHDAGMALCKKHGSGWTTVKIIKGSFADAAALQALGVPAVQAKALINDVAIAKAHPI